MPSLTELEQWMEEQLPPNLHDLPMKVTSTIQSYSSHLYSQLYDLTPSYSQIESSIESSLQSIPFVGAHCTSTPPSPPPPVSIFEAMMRRADAVTGSRTRTSVVASVGVVGITCAVLTRSAWLPMRLRKRGERSPKIVNGSRQEAIIVLGADTPLGQSLCHHLSAQGFIVLASVSDEDSMQVFDSLIPPSSRGYIKSIILNPIGSRAEEIDCFVQSIASAKELRWPLTSAGDPYSRPGTEVQFTALINTLSYKSVADKSLVSSMHIDQLTRDMTMRVSTPLAAIQALLPLMSSGDSPSCTFVVSIIAPDSELSSQALIAGMRRLKGEVAGKGRLLLTTLEAQSSSLQSRCLSVLPSRVGGAAPISMQEIKTPSSSLASSRVTDTKGQSMDKNPARPRNTPRTASSSDVRLQRTTEFKPILQAVAGLVLLPLSTSSLRARYTVQLAPSVLPTQTQESRGLERSILLGAIRASWIPFIVLSSALNRLDPRCWFSSWSRSPPSYSGSRNAANSRPAFGPGPGPASNTHSRSCIRPNSENSRSSRRPRSTNSAASSEAAKSTDANSTGPPSSTATASGPPSNNGMSSSGLLSSVPSSAFGDGSEEEHFDFEDGDNSPIQGSGPWASPIVSDHDSDTALGARTEQHDEMEATPSGSRANIEGEVQYGFPSQASMESSESWMGPASRGSPTPSEPSTRRSPFTANSAVPGTPLGQSWVVYDENNQ